MGETILCDNLDYNFFHRARSQLQRFPVASFNLCQRFLLNYRHEGPVELSLQDQIKLLNCFEPKFVHFPYVRGPSTWNRMSTKQGVLDDRIEEVLLMQARQQTLALTLNRQGHRFGKNTVKHSRQTGQSIRSLKSQFVSMGFLRLLYRDRLKISVAWNAYNACSGTVTVDL